MKLHAAFLATLLAAGTTVAMAQTAGQSTAPSSSDDQMQSQQPVSGQSNQNTTNPGAPDQNTGNAQPQSGEEIAGQVSQAISSDSSVGGIVHVRVKGNSLVLDGTVTDKKAKNRAEQIATPFATNNNLKLVDHITATDEY